MYLTISLNQWVLLLNIHMGSETFLQEKYVIATLVQGWIGREDKPIPT